jgi:membrane-associated protein
VDQAVTIFQHLSHLDTYLRTFIDNHGLLVYIIIGIIVFFETGLLILAPILPSDTLIFTAGAIAAGGSLRIELLIIIFSIAAIAGDSLNYLFGCLLKDPLFSGKIPFLNPHKLDRVRDFYKRHGSITVLYGRFIPVIRTFIPFTAGSGSMAYPRFLKFCIIGVLCWVLLNSLTGFFFSKIPIVQEYPGLILLGLALFALIPGVIQFCYYRFSTKKD